MQIAKLHPFYHVSRCFYQVLCLASSPSPFHHPSPKYRSKSTVHPTKPYVHTTNKIRNFFQRISFVWKPVFLFFAATAAAAPAGDEACQPGFCSFFACCSSSNPPTLVFPLHPASSKNILHKTSPLSLARSLFLFMLEHETTKKKKFPILSHPFRTTAHLKQLFYNKVIASSFSSAQHKRSKICAVINCYIIHLFLQNLYNLFMPLVKEMLWQKKRRPSLSVVVVIITFFLPLGLTCDPFLLISMSFSFLPTALPFIFAWLIVSLRSLQKTLNLLFCAKFQLDDGIPPEMKAVHTVETQ